MARAAPIDGFASVINGVPNSEENDYAFLVAAVGMWRVNAASDQPLGAEGTDLFDETYYRLDGTGPVSGDVSGVFSRLGTILSATVQLNGPADYIVAHWGGPRGGADIMYYVGGLFIDTPITLTLIPDDRAGRLGGISSITLFGNTSPGIPARACRTEGPAWRSSGSGSAVWSPSPAAKKRADGKGRYRVLHVNGADKAPFAFRPWR